MCRSMYAFNCNMFGCGPFLRFKNVMVVVFCDAARSAKAAIKWCEFSSGYYYSAFVYHSYGVDENRFLLLIHLK